MLGGMSTLEYSVVSDYTHDFGGRSIRLPVTSVAGRLLCGQRPRDYKDEDLADLASHTRGCRLSGSTIKGWKGIPRRHRASPVMAHRRAPRHRRVPD